MSAFTNWQAKQEGRLTWKQKEIAQLLVSIVDENASFDDLVEEVTTWGTGLTIHEVEQVCLAVIYCLGSDVYAAD